MISIIKNHFPLFITICILVIILVIALCFACFYNRTTIFYRSKTELAELLRADFTDVEITHIQYKNSKDGIWDNYTRIVVFLKESGEWESKGYYTNSEEWFDSSPEHMLSSETAELKIIGIELNNIQKRGVNFNQIKVGFSIGGFGVYWYHIDDSYDGESNVVLIAGVPRKVSIDIDRIIKLE